MPINKFINIMKNNW